MDMFNELCGPKTNGDSNTNTGNQEETIHKVHQFDRDRSDNPTNGAGVKTDQRDDNDAPRDLFGELIESATPQQRAKPKGEVSSSKAVTVSTAATTASTASKRGWKDQNVEVGIDFTVHYAMRTFRVEELIEEIPESGKVHLNMIREGLFKEYWDFSESRTKWDYDLDQKKLIPIIVGEKNNCL
ncbi:hypothetical protein [Paenibacillus periandrae]|uniref:hypothetical protein n=1 Tax=Paenibacillus periandrae TaxID=1761741 RepID=UPI001F09054D|nr:hypothetical protein [Paenibacillus periandrae]